MEKAIFLDRDGTINKDTGYVSQIKEFEFLPGVVEALKILNDLGFLLIIITNQSGIARGFYSENDFVKLDNWMRSELLKHGIRISKTYYCPHLSISNIPKYRKACQCRKPKTGLFEQAIREFNIDLKNSFVIGDHMRDCELARKNKCYGMLVGNTEDLRIIKKVSDGKYSNILYFENLFQCALYIKKVSTSNKFND